MTVAHNVKREFTVLTIVFCMCAGRDFLGYYREF